MNWQAILLAVLVVFVFVFGAWYIRRTTREDQTEAVEYIGGPDGDDGHTKGAARIPITARAKGLSTPAKVMFGSMALLFVVLGIFVYQTLSTGSPAEILFADQLRTVSIALVGVIGGIIISNIAQKNEGNLYNVYETDSGDTRTEVIPVDISGIDADSEGHQVVTEYKRRRILGLFRRHKLVGEEPELDGTHRAPGKPVRHQIADHAIEADDGVWFQRTAGRDDTTNPKKKPDFIYSSPVELSIERYLDARASVKRMQKRVQNKEATIAIIEREFEKLKNRVEMGEYNAEDKLIDKFERLADILQHNVEDEAEAGDPRQTRVTLNEQADGRQPSQQARADGGSL